jgi:hypothetical protein
MASKEDALHEIIALAKHNKITILEIENALKESPTSKASNSSNILSKLLGYIGGIFVFAGICVFIGMYWDDFGSAARVIITLGSGFTLFILALLAEKDAKYNKVSTPLYLISTALQPTGIFVMLDEYSSGGDPRHGALYMAAIMLIQHGATFWARRKTLLAFTSIIFGCVFFTTLFDIFELDGNLIGVTIGISLICVAYAANNSKHTAISPFWYFVGSLMLLGCSFDALQRTMFEIGYLGLTAVLIFLSTVTRSRVLLLTGTIAMIHYIGYFTAEHFANTLGWPLSLIFLGFVLIGLSSYAVKINNKYIKAKN